MELGSLDFNCDLQLTGCVTFEKGLTLSEHLLASSVKQEMTPTFWWGVNNVGAQSTVATLAVLVNQEGYIRAVAK